MCSRYIAARAEARDFFREIDSLSVKWHTFDLEKIDQATDEVLSRLEAKRDEISAGRSRE